MNKKYPIVKITWQDATYYHDGWTTIEECPIVINNTVGFLLKKTKKYLTLAYSLGGLDNFQGILLIPRDWVMKMRVIK